MIPTGITLPITMGKNSTMPSGDIVLVPPRDTSNITEYSYESKAYKSKITNSKVNLVDSYSPTLTT